MRREDWFVDNARHTTFGIIYYSVVFIALITTSILFGWGWIFLSLAFATIHGMSLNEGSNKERIEYWFSGPKRKFRAYMGADDKSYVETKVGFFWIPIWDIENLEPAIYYDKQTGEKIERPRQRFVLATWDSVEEAMQFVHKKRGFSSATLQGQFEA